MKVGALGLFFVSSVHYSRDPQI